MNDLQPRNCVCPHGHNYAKMIEEYEQQIAAVEEKIERRKRQIKARTATPQQRKQAEDALGVLYEMWYDLKFALKSLQRLAEEETQ